MIDTPGLIEIPAQAIALVHIETPRERMQQVMGPGIGEVMAAAKAQGLGPAGPWFAHHLRMSRDAFDFDICVPVTAPVSPTGRVVPGERPAMKVVRTVHHGSYEGLGGAWQAFTAWAETNRYRTASDLYECYLVGPETSADPAAWRTELSRRVVD